MGDEVIALREWQGKRRRRPWGQPVIMTGRGWVRKVRNPNIRELIELSVPSERITLGSWPELLDDEAQHESPEARQVRILERLFEESEFRNRAIFLFPLALVRNVAVRGLMAYGAWHEDEVDAALAGLTECLSTEQRRAFIASVLPHLPDNLAKFLHEFYELAQSNPIIYEAEGYMAGRWYEPIRDDSGFLSMDEAEVVEQQSTAAAYVVARLLSQRISPAHTSARTHE